MKSWILCSVLKMEISVYFSSRCLCGTKEFVVTCTRRATEVADAARFAEQARTERSPHGRLEEEMNRTGEPRTPQVSASKVKDDSQRRYRSWKE